MFIRLSSIFICTTAIASLVSSAVFAVEMSTEDHLVEIFNVQYNVTSHASLCVIENDIIVAVSEWVQGSGGHLTTRTRLICYQRGISIKWQLEFPSSGLHSLTTNQRNHQIILSLASKLKDSQSIVYCIDDSANILWSLPLKCEFASEPISLDDSIYFSDSNGSYYSVSSSGTIDWIYDHGLVASKCEPFQMYDNLLYPCYNNVLLSVRMDGTLNWTAQLPDIDNMDRAWGHEPNEHGIRMIASPVAWKDTHILQITRDGILCYIDMNGNLLDQNDICSLYCDYAPIVIMNNDIVIGSKQSLSLISDGNQVSLILDYDAKGQSITCQPMKYKERFVIYAITDMKICVYDTSTNKLKSIGNIDSYVRQPGVLYNDSILFISDECSIYSVPSSAFKD
jgi:outer membrane protein assembly factor BamB